MGGLLLHIVLFLFQLLLLILSALLFFFSLHIGHPTLQHKLQGEVFVGRHAYKRARRRKRSSLIRLALLLARVRFSCTLCSELQKFGISIHVSSCFSSDYSTANCTK